MRSRMGGWVAKRLATKPSLAVKLRSSGSAMHRCATPRLIDLVGAEDSSIFSRALARAPGFLISSAPEASARYSRLREMAMAIIWAIIGARIMNNSQTANMISAAPPPLLRDDDDERPRPDQRIARPDQSESRTTAPTIAATTVTNRMS